MAWFWQGMAISSVVMATAIPQTFGLKWYRETLANYKSEKELPIDENTLSLINKVLDLLNVPEERRSLMQFFLCFDNNPVHKGDINMNTGTIIGIPPTFAYYSPSDIDKDLLSVGSDQKVVDWDSEVGSNLQLAMVLSENAKTFAIAREINYVQTWDVYSNLFIKGAFFISGYTAIHYMEQLLQMRQRLHSATRFGIYSLVASAFGLLYLVGSDSYNCWQDVHIDRKTAMISKTMAEGGTEFYLKTLQRNKAVRSLMGDFGGRFYTQYGNEVATWRNRHMQLTGRLEIVRNQLKEWEQSETNKEIF